MHLKHIQFYLKSIYKRYSYGWIGDYKHRKEQVLHLLPAAGVPLSEAGRLPAQLSQCEQDSRQSSKRSLRTVRVHSRRIQQQPALSLQRPPHCSQDRRKLERGEEANRRGRQTSRKAERQEGKAACSHSSSAEPH